MKQYNFVACAGTFDLFHKGHREFLRFALLHTRHLLIGITNDTFNDAKRNSILPFADRKKDVISFLEKEKVISRVTIVAIDDVYGPTLTNMFPIEALVVTEKTLSGANRVNEKRKSLGLSKLDIIICLLEKAEDLKEISSTRIREGEIDREGNLFIRPEWFTHTLYLPEEVRLLLKKPLGVLFTKANGNISSLDSSRTITVGDVVTKMGNDMALGQILSIVDFTVQREKKYTDIKELGFSGSEKVVRLRNQAGSLTPELFKAVQTFFQGKNSTRFVICINGEEDLAVLPVLLVAPLKFIVLYGQPNIGIVKIIVTEEIKNKTKEIVAKFTL